MLPLFVILNITSLLFQTHTHTRTFLALGVEHISRILYLAGPLVISIVKCVDVVTIQAVAVLPTYDDTSPSHRLITRSFS